MCQLIEGEPDLSVVGQSGSAEEGLRQARQLHPSVIVMDLALPGMNGLAATRHLVAQDPSSRILVLSNHVGPDLVQWSLAAGAKGLVRKDRAFEELIPAIRAVGRNLHFMGEGVETE
jgi:DNA-binding NarL/FixJ family response regulator